jgi:flagellar basal body rod protein FlgB
MMNLGIALGSFSQGFAQGIQLGTTLDAVRTQRKLKDAVSGITKEGKAEFDTQVKAGKADAGDFDAFYANHLVPKIANEYLLANEPDKAQAWTDWAESSSAKKASKLFGSGLQKLQMGDIQGGMDDMMKTADTKGYGPDGKMTAAEIYDEGAGKVTGYRLTYKLANGQEHSKNVAAADLPSFFASTINPQAAFELQQSQQAAESKADLDVKTYTRKKQAEKDLGVGAGALTEAQYQNAIQEERKRIEESSLTDPDMADATADEKEQLAKDTVDKRLGKVTATADEPQVAVDPSTGQQVQLPTAAAPTQSQVQPQAAQPAPGPVDTGQAPAGVQMPQAAPSQPTADTAPGIVAPSPQAATTQVAPSDRQAYLAQATQQMKQGANGQDIAKSLIAAGIPPEQWPQDVQLAVRNSMPGVSQ